MTLGIEPKINTLESLNTMGANPTIRLHMFRKHHKIWHL